MLYVAVCAVCDMRAAYVFCVLYVLYAQYALYAMYVLYMMNLLHVLCARVCVERQAPVPRPHISAVINAIRCSLAKDSEKAMGHSWSRGFDDHEGAALSPASSACLLSAGLLFCFACLLACMLASVLASVLTSVLASVLAC